MIVGIGYALSCRIQLDMYYTNQIDLTLNVNHKLMIRCCDEYLILQSVHF